jgi:beta-glucosidase-like glycosyl hydrolase
VNISDLDRAVSNVLRVKFATGLFDRPANVTMRTPEELDTPAFRQVVREAAEQVRQRFSGFLRPLLRY